jgi:hypothetical protein
MYIHCFAKVGDVKPMEMNRLELEFLLAVWFCLHIGVSRIENYCSVLQSEIMLSARFQIKKRMLLQY